MIFSVTNLTDFVDWFETIHKMWSCSFWTLPRRGLSLKNLPPRNTPDSFCRRFTRQNHRCAAWAVFFTNRTLCGCTILWNSLLIVDNTTSKRYSCAWKKPDAVRTLQPASFKRKNNTLRLCSQQPKTNFGRLNNYIRFYLWKRKIPPSQRSDDFVGWSKRQNESGVLRGG